MYFKNIHTHIDWNFPTVAKREDAVPGPTHQDEQPQYLIAHTHAAGVWQAAPERELAAVRTVATIATRTAFATRATRSLLQIKQVVRACVAHVVCS